MNAPYQNRIAEAGEWLLLAGTDEANALICLYAAMLAIVQAIHERERPGDEEGMQ